jgi:uncharacterized membrane protein YfhO
MPDPDLPAILRLPAAQHLPLKLLRYAPDELDFEITCPAAGWLLVTDRWSRGWHARINGSPAEVFGADFIFRALRASPGQNVVQMYYRPLGFPWLLIVSWGLLAVIGANSLRRSRL